MLAGERHALVTGIDRYAHVTPLLTLRKDAEAVSDALHRLDFRVTCLLDPGRRDIDEALSGFAAQLQPGDEDFVIGEAIGVDRVLGTLQRRGVRVSLLILDACHDNPFPTEGTRALGATRGLARGEPREGAFILVSAGSGQAALDRLSADGPDPDPVFARALLPRLMEPGLDMLTLTREVRRDARSRGRSRVGMTVERRDSGVVILRETGRGLERF